MEIFEAERIASLMRDVGPDTLIEFLQMLPGELAGLQADLARGVEAGDSELIARTRHTIKGMSQSIGATGLAQVVTSIGKDGPELMPAQMADLARQIVTACQEAEDLIAQIRSEPERLMVSF
jgi:HPt (histidine-containing phosphotransfer) domain-containing protein